MRKCGKLSPPREGTFANSHAIRTIVEITSVFTSAVITPNS